MKAEKCSHQNGSSRRAMALLIDPPQSVKCFEQPFRLQTKLTLPRAYIHCTRYADKKPFAQFASRANGEAGWRTYELDASHSPNLTAPTALMEVLKQILPA